MIEQVNSIKDWVQLIISVITLMGLILVFHKRYIAPTLDKVDAMSDIINAQMTKNHGTTLLDKVDATHERTKKIPQIEKEIIEIKGKIHSIEEKLSDKDIQ